MNRLHHMQFGTRIHKDGRVRFRLWAPARMDLSLVLRGTRGEKRLPMTRAESGWFEIATDEAGPGSRYGFWLEDGLCVPDPASRFQPDDVHGLSEVINPLAYAWQDSAWRGRPWEEVVLYELHVGAFTRAGTFRATIEKLDYLADLGVTAIELMPIADFPGRRNWGYDGVLPFAPDASYGRPEDLKALVDAAHARGLMVFLDVVYNHFGPEGNYLHCYAPQFFTERHKTPWGAAINFDDAGNRTVRDFFIHNALYWLEEYHFDGLRLDAVDRIRDDSHPDILEELARTVRKNLGQERHVHLVLENERNAARYLVRGRGGQAVYYDAQWNDDAHHAYHVLLTGEHDGYYADYAAAPIRLLGRCLTEGFAYQGEPSEYRHGEARGEPSTHLPPSAFVSFLQNHDQVGNRALGERMARLAAPEAMRAATALFLLAPSPPLLFMGEEWGAREPFPFFCDFTGELADAVTAGRRREFSRFERFREPAMQRTIPDPCADKTFESSRLNWSSMQQSPHREWLALYRELLALRREVVVSRLRGARGEGYRVLAPRALRAGWRLGDDARLDVYANLGATPVDVTDAPTGKPFYGNTAGFEQSLSSGVLPAFTVAWYLGGADGRRA